MDIDLNTGVFGNNECPMNKDNGKKNKCAVKDTSICEHFKGIENLDTVICDYK